MYNKLSDFNIYSKRIGFFLNGKEMTGTPFGIFLTFIYIISSITLFAYYIYIIIQRRQMNIYMTQKYIQKKSRP